MGVEMIKDRFGEDQLVLSNEDFYNDDVMGDKFSNYDIMKIIKSNTGNFLAKVISKKNSKIYVLKQFRQNQDQQKLVQEFQILNKLNHSNIIKYFKWFNEDGKVYFVKEYVDNGSLKNLKEAYRSINKPIEENTLWNIFMQCTAGLDYLHSNNIVHKNLKSNNILMNENKVIKIDDIQFNQDPKDKSDDIREMGEIFSELIPIEFQNQYPQEMIGIVNAMKNNFKNINSTQLLNKIMEQYIKSVAKVSSINAIFRCMSALQPFSYAMYQKGNSFSENNTPVAYYYMQCLNTYLNPNGNPKDTIIYYNNFRNLLYKNSQMNNDVEIRPRQVLEFYTIKNLKPEDIRNLTKNAKVIRRTKTNPFQGNNNNNPNQEYRIGFGDNLGKTFMNIAPAGYNPQIKSYEPNYHHPSLSDQNIIHFPKAMNINKDQNKALDKSSVIYNNIYENGNNNI